MALAPGTRFGPYEVSALLGAGGMGEVYRARDVRLGREIALKILPAAFAEQPERMRRFEEEARMASRLNHPNIVTIHDIGNEGGIAFIAMELVEGESIRERISRGAFPPAESAAIAAQIAAGLARAHAAGIVHRDLKPENVMIAPGGLVKILDFGLARIEAERVTSTPSSAPTRTSPTGAGAILGTVGYMSPEQARGAPTDARTDLFAFGALLYEMLAGRPAFPGGTVAALSAILAPGPPDLSGIPDGTPPGLARIVRRCLEKDPERRLSSAHDLSLQLRDLAVPAAPTLRTRSSASRVRRKAIDSVAVLPLINVGGDPAHEYLTDGVTESIIHGLSELPKLQVMALSTVSRFRGRDPLEAGRALGVRAVLTGKLTGTAERLRVQAELVDAQTGFRIWGEAYDRPMADLLEVQDEIAREICDHLRFKLSGAERRRVAKAPTRNAQAYQAYLKGRYFWNKWTTEGVKSAIELYERAIEIDPAYALAWGGMADAYGIMGSMKITAPDQAFPKARAAALRALEIDPRLADAHASLAYVHWLHDWDWPAAEASFRESLRLNPSYATGHRWYGQFLSGLGRGEEALEEVRRALDLDPLSLIIHTAVGDALFYARRYRESIEFYRKSLEMDPDFQAGHSDLARALEFSGEIDEAIREYEAAIRLSGATAADASVGRANALAVAGNREEALAILDQLQRRRAERFTSPWGIASIYARLGEPEEALSWLELAYAEHDPPLVWLKVHPRFDALRSHPRFLAILRRMNLE
ncbi:MAG TPA: protein kinase [Thermoanaerobaculia bacterium]|nr:protein kinase [Thermoanaerobaculia bacterium]